MFRLNYQGFLDSSFSVARYTHPFITAAIAVTISTPARKPSALFSAWYMASLLWWVGDLSVARYAESSQALVSYWRLPGRRLRNFAWLHVEPRPVPELAWGGEFVDRAVCRSRPRRDVPKLCKEL
jgi:hypothetical protein